MTAEFEQEAEQNQGEKEVKSIRTRRFRLTGSRFCKNSD